MEPAPPATAERSSERPPERGPERGDDRDRHGRRSRRRRSNNRRGIPESKYAAESAPQPHPTSAPADASGAEPAAAEETTPIVLPGESLAKYKDAPETAIAPAVNGSTPAVEEEYDEPIHYPPENALPDAPEHPEIAEEAEAASEPAEEVEEEIESAEESGPAVAPMLDEEEDRDIQEMILSHAGGMVEEIAGGEEETEAATEEAAVEGESENAEAAQESSVESNGGTAAVRERGGQYPHRISRRMRRRGGRGGVGAGTRSLQGTYRAGRAYRRPSRAADAVDLRSAQGGPGDHRPDRQGAAGAKRRAHHFTHRAARPLRGLHADARAHGRFAQNRER